MTSFILRRLIQSIIVIGFLSFACFYLMTLMPGDPIDLMVSANPHITSDDVERLKKLYGLDQPAYKRYYYWISDILKGDLGYSRTYKVPVSDLLGSRLLNTFYLSISALFLALLIAVPFGIIAALKQGSKTDYIINLFAFAGISMPAFWLAIILIMVFGVYLKVLPAGGTASYSEDLSGWSHIGDRIQYLILPTCTLAIIQIGTFVRYTRSAMIETMRFDFIRTARAKGLGYWTVVLKHGFRNALLPIITIISMSVSYIFSGALLTETVFSYQGVGKLVYESIIANDYNVAMISFMISVSMVLVMTLIADLLYGIADPRVTYK